jgi:mannose-1-phosphate guanylyltransferase
VEDIETTSLDGGEHVWAVILAGTRALDRTLRQVGQVIPAERTIVMAAVSDHTRVARVARDGMHVLVEPDDRGTAATILLPVHWIHARDQHALVVVLAGDLPMPGDAAAGRHVARAARCAERHPDSLILTGVSGGSASEHGFIVPGERIDSAGEAPLCRVQRLVELGPDAQRDRTLANVPMLAGRAEAFIRAAAEVSPSLNERLARAVTFAGREHEHWALKQAYALAPRVDFFRSVLQEIARSLAVIAVADVGRDEPATWRSLGWSAAPISG